jgi:hypothetical protein
MSVFMIWSDDATAIKENLHTALAELTAIHYT